MKKSMFIIALAVAAAACNNPQNNQETEEPAVEQHVETATEAIADLAGKEWKLVTLNGEAIVLDDEFPAEPHLIFDEDGNRVSGNAGCNSFGGNLELSGNDGITMSGIVATQMACPNLEVEGQFVEALRNTVHYHVHGNTLSLHGEGHTDLATLEVSETP